MYKKIFLSSLMFLIVVSPVTFVLSSSTNVYQKPNKQSAQTIFTKPEIIIQESKEEENFNKINQSLKNIKPLLSLVGMSMEIKFSKEQFLAINSLQKKGLRYILPKHLEQIMSLTNGFLPESTISQENLSKILSYLLNNGGIESLLKDQELNFINTLNNLISANLSNSEDKAFVKKYLNTILFEGFNNHHTFIKDTTTILELFGLEINKPFSFSGLINENTLDSTTKQNLNENKENNTFPNANLKNFFELITFLYWNPNKQIEKISNVFIKSVNFNSAFTIIQKGFFNASSDDWNHFFSSLQNILKAEIKLNPNDKGIKIIDFLSEDMEEFIENLTSQFNNEKTSEIINKLLKQGISFINKEDLKYFVKIMKVLLPFSENVFKSKNAGLKFLKTFVDVLENKEYIFEDILENGFQTTKNATQSEKIFFLKQILNSQIGMDVFAFKSIFDIEKEIFAPLFGIDIEKYLKDDKVFLTKKLETQYALLKSQTLPEIEKTITSLKAKETLNDSLIKKCIRAWQILSENEEEK